MATRKALEQQANELNRDQRNLRKYVLYSLKSYWSQTNLCRKKGLPEGCTAISGGNAAQRETVLRGMLTQAAESRIPTVVIADCGKMPSLENAMIDIVMGRPGSRLIITSKKNNNYDFFSGWALSNIIDFFVACARSYGENTANLAAFLCHYFHLVEKVYGEVTLRTLLDASKPSKDGLESIEVLEEKLGSRLDFETREALNYLEATTEPRETWKVVLQKVRERLGSLQTEDAGYNLNIFQPSAGEIILIHAEDTLDPELLSLYFQAELASERTLPFQLIVAECTDEKMVSWLKSRMSNGNAVAICVRSLYALLGEEVAKLPFRNMVFLFDKGSKDLNVEKELALLGFFNYWQVTEGGSSPPVAFSFWTGTHAGLVNTHLGKVQPQNVRDCEAVLYGHNKQYSQNEIALVRFLRD